MTLERRDPPSMDDLMKIVASCPICHAWWTVYEMGDCTKEQSLIGMVVSLSKQNQGLFDNVLKMAQEETSIVIKGVAK